MRHVDGGDAQRPLRLHPAWPVALVAAVGLSLFAFLAWRSVTIERAEPNDALGRFAQIESQFNSSKPLLRIETDGTVSRRALATGEPVHLSRLRVLAYRVREQQLVHVGMPFWFLKLKGRAAQYALRDTGLDLNRLGVTPAELERYGPGVVLDETGPNGDRLVVWTE